MIGAQVFTSNCCLLMSRFFTVYYNELCGLQGWCPPASPLYPVPLYPCTPVPLHPCTPVPLFLQCSSYMYTSPQTPCLPSPHSPRRRDRIPPHSCEKTNSKTQCYYKACSPPIIAYTGGPRTVWLSLIQMHGTRV